MSDTREPLTMTKGRRVNRIECVCGRSVRPEKWANHLLGDGHNSRSRGPHAVLQEPAGGLTVEETRLLQRLDLLEANPETTRSWKLLHTRLEKRLTHLAEHPA
jgi:hypothetical protein